MKVAIALQRGLLALTLTFTVSSTATLEPFTIATDYLRDCRQAAGEFVELSEVAKKCAAYYVERGNLGGVCPFKEHALVENTCFIKTVKKKEPFCYNEGFWKKFVAEDKACAANFDVYWNCQGQLTFPEFAAELNKMVTLDRGCGIAWNNNTAAIVFLYKRLNTSELDELRRVSVEMQEFAATTWAATRAIEELAISVLVVLVCFFVLDLILNF